MRDCVIGLCLMLTGCYTMKDIKPCYEPPRIRIIKWPNEPARQIGDRESLGVALGRSVTTIHRLEDALQQQQNLIRQAGAAEEPE